MVKSPPLSHYQRGTIQVPRPVRKNGKTVDPTNIKAVTGWPVPAPSDGSVSHQKGASKKCIGSQFPPRKLHRLVTKSILKLSKSNLSTVACISFLMCLRMSSMD